MRVCPVCHARAFDDAEVCYGCMHRFSGKEPAAAPMPGNAHKGGAVGPLPQETQMRAQAPSPGANAAPWADARQAALAKERSAEQPQRSLSVDGVSGIEQCLDGEPCGSAPVIARNVSVSAGGADIVVRIELVGAVEENTAAKDDAARQAAQAAACQLLRRGRPIRGSVGARPADVQRGASAGQGAEQARSIHPRHAAELQAVSA
ncbi:hypothetical protein [uncultured Senegalimassilia sp.]|uniref:hypothetical protein n=1 Tax=uncultured Senegalimassilia sp. TaxID=1714350 RepID=UPI0027DB37EF|nr:hypothetical protein [uncultured Senegalimassilia sp.]